MDKQRIFAYPFARRWFFLLLAVANVPLVVLAANAPLLGPERQWVVYVLCANIIVAPLGIQLVRLARNMIVTVSEGAISGRSFFGREITLAWGDIRRVVRVLLPLRGATIVVVPRRGGAAITFGETIRGLDELLAIIRQRAKGCELSV